MSDQTESYTVIQCVEHQDISDKIRELFPNGFSYQEQPKDSMPHNIWALGLSKEGCLNYYIGVDWLDEKNTVALRVSPKICSIDYLKMFQVCLESPVARNYISKTYDVKIDATYIPQDDGADFSIILILHFLYVLEELIRKPLRKGYVSYTENLSAKLKGKIQIGSHIKKNLMNLRTDRMYCTYQQFSTDCLENRILKTAFEESIQFLAEWNQNNPTSIPGIFHFERIATTFSEIGKIANLRELQGVKSNSIYKGYAEALRLAKLILRIRGYQNEYRSKQIRYIPPFVIDMSKLFELFVYHHLYLVLGDSITFQSQGKYGMADFLNLKEKLIIDAKYKPSTYKDRYDIDDIRQVSGYARDVGILRKLGVTDLKQVIPCLLIYPSKEAPADLSSSYKQYRENVINQFIQIYRLGIRLPTII